MAYQVGLEDLDEFEGMRESLRAYTETKGTKIFEWAGCIECEWS